MNIVAIIYRGIFHLYILEFYKITASLSVVAIGVAMGWTSPILPELEKNGGPLGSSISKDESSWIGSLITVGAIFGSFVAGYLGERYSCINCSIARTRIISQDNYLTVCLIFRDTNWKLEKRVDLYKEIKLVPNSNIWRNRLNWRGWKLIFSVFIDLALNEHCYLLWCHF